MEYINILLPIIVFTVVLLFVSNSSLFNSQGSDAKNSPANSLLKGLIGIEIVVLILLLALQL